MSSATRQSLVIGAFAVLAALTASFAVAAFTRQPIVSSVPAATFTANDPTGFQAGIFTSGDATVSVRPDMAFITAGVDAQASSASAAQKSVATQANKLVAKAKALGFADKDVSTAGYNIGPMYSSDGRTITGYQASEQLEMKWHNVDTAGAALDALVQEGGATRIGISFGLNDFSGPQAQARTNAIAEARDRAQAMAKAAGVSLGQVIRVVDYTSGPRTPVDYAPAAADARGASTVVPVGQLDVTVTVEVDFAIA
ncbi:MAG TPA: SIMPL domain-containing protein [Candidatus Dormibacteraeota bacterium]|nr:SIMPL domain-containing protein [Candidatus Dormibacteraeota bacterium]